MHRRIAALVIVVVAWLWVGQAHAVPRDADTVYRDGFDPYGTLLEGPPDRLAIDAIVDMPPVPAPESDIEDDLILTRLDLFIDRTATVGQINAAITAVGGWIVTMTSGRAALTISIPRAADRTELRARRDALNAREGILMASLAEVVAEQMLPDPPAGDALHAGYLYASRFPAAWNASRIAIADCTSRKVRLRFLDLFSALSPDLSQVVQDQLPNFHLLTPLPTGRPTLHGYEVAMTAAAQFDPVSQTGADPFPECLDLQGTGANGMSWVERAWMTSAGIGEANAVVNASVGNRRPCTTACTPADFDKEDIVADAFRGIEWRAGARAHDGNVLFVTAAGNDFDRPIANLYPYYAIADFASPMNLSASAEFLGDVPADDSDDFTFLRNPLLLDPIDPAYPSLIASDADMQRVRRYAYQNLGMEGAVRSPNILVVGSTTRAAEAAQVRPSLFSDPGSAIQAVGEGILGLDGRMGSGTSVSAPQVSGLVSYLWLLSDELRAAPLATTVAAITANARSANDATVLDAYASVLSLDAADPTGVTPSAQTMPIRLALLDVDGDGRFTETDLTTIQQHLLTSGGPSQLQDGSRYDLNGDGYTGGFHADRFDLDRVGSTQFGASVYTRVSGSIDGLTRTYDENQLLDIDILCYYAYSPLYTGDTGVRTQAIGAACGNPFGGHDTLDLDVPLQNAYSGGASGYIFASGSFGYYSFVQRFSFATMGWGTAERFDLDTDPIRILGFAANADDADVLLGMASPTLPMESRRYEPSLDTWSPEAFVDVSTAPRFAPSDIDPAFACGPDGSAVVAWVAGSDVQRSLVASRFDPVAHQWLAPETVAATMAGPLPTRPSALVDASGNAYVVTYARSFPTSFYRFDHAAETWSAIEDFPGVYVYSLGVDASGRLLGVGGDAQGRIVSSRYEPATGHWSALLALPVSSTSDLSALAGGLPFAPYGGGSEACALRLLCMDAQGNALVLLPVTLVEPDGTRTFGAFRLDAATNRWQDLGVVGRGGSFSIGMGYQSGNADIAWSTDTFGSMYVRHVDARTGLRPAQMFFQSSRPVDYYLVPPAVLHDEGDAAIVVWSSASSSGSQITNYWMPVY